jgi:hypothetical protein
MSRQSAYNSSKEGLVAIFDQFKNILFSCTFSLHLENGVIGVQIWADDLQSICCPPSAQQSMTEISL